MSIKKLRGDNLNDRLRLAIEYLSVNQDVFASKAEMSHSYINQILNGKKGISAVYLIAIEHVWGISRRWLETGEGEMFALSADRKPIENLRYPNICITIGGGENNEQSDYAAVPILENSAAAEYPLLISDDQVIGYTVINKSKIGGGKLLAIYVHGDSMAPILNDGDLAIVDIQQANPPELIGHVVAVVVEGVVTIIRLAKGREGRFLLIPKNQEHLPLDLNPCEFRVIGRVIFTWKRL